jgi:chromosome segregation protein
MAFARHTTREEQMRLKRLIVHGFKSFKDRTTIQFDDNITGIVGPNGCGKSNIVDALFWVMGEMSAKHLRGNTMKDVIFSGSTKHKPASWAEVSLILDNDDNKHIHIGNKVSSPTEIQLTRKLYRNGDSEYRINGSPCRLKDIQEVFMDTGAGAKSYSIIAQGEINKLVQSKPEDRRTIIEEVAGIMKFKLRRRESMKKIDQTQENLNRLSDLKNEIEKNLRSLQNQAEKAERAKSLKEKIQRNEIVTNAHKVYESLRSLKEGKKLVNEIKVIIEGDAIRKNGLEVSLENERIKKEVEIQELDVQQTEYNQVSRELAAEEEKFRYLEVSKEEKTKLITEKAEEINNLENEKEERKEKLANLQEKYDHVVEESKEEVDFSQLDKEATEFKNIIQSKTSELNELVEKIEIDSERFQSLDQTVFKNTSRLDEYSAQLQDMSEEVETLEKQYSGVSQDISKAREGVRIIVDKMTTLKNREDELKASNLSLSSEHIDFEKNYKETIQEYIQVESKLNSLKDIRDSLEGLKEGTTNFIQSEMGESHKLLGNIIECDERYTKAVQSSLSTMMDAVVAASGMDHSEVQNWLKENRELGMDILSPSSKNQTNNYAETIERLEVNGCSGVKSLQEIISIKDEDYSYLTTMFSGMFMVENLSEIDYLGFSNEINFHSIVSPDGSICLRNASKSRHTEISSEVSSEQGMVARNNLIADLEIRFNELSEMKIDLEARKETLESTFNSCKEEFEVVRQDHSDIRAEHASLTSSLNSKLENTESGHSRLNILKNRIGEISKSRLDLLENEDGFKTDRDNLEIILSELKLKSEEFRKEMSEMNEEYNSKREFLIEKKLEHESYNVRLSENLSQKDDVSLQLERIVEKLSQHSDSKDDIGVQLETIEESIRTLEVGNKDKANLLQEREVVLKERKDSLAKLLQEMQEREDEVKNLTRLISKNEKEIDQKEVRFSQSLVQEEQVVKNMFEKYQIDLRQAVGAYLEYSEDEFLWLNDLFAMYTMETESGPMEVKSEPYEFIRRYGQDLRECENKYRRYKGEYNRLGEINWKAVEDYNRQKLRFDFLKDQEEELKASLEDLEKAITHIDEKSRERFKLAFNEVNERFQKVFPIIFGGGSASLKIVGDMNDPDCGIDIVAQPPGKKMQNINLMSGGEKALTAVSLIFSIFLVKPSPFCLLDEVDAPLDDANVGRFTELLKEMSDESQFILITHNKKTMELNDTLYGVTMQEPGVSKAVSVQLH